MNHFSRRSLVVGAGASLLVPGALANAPAALATTSDPALPQNGDGRYSVSHYDIGDTVLTHPSDNARVYGQTTMTAQANVAMTDVLVDIALPVTRALINGTTVTATRTSWRQVKLTGLSLAAGASFTCQVYYDGYPDTVNHTAYHNGEIQTGSYLTFSGEPDSSVYWFASNDRLNNKATYMISVSTQASNQILGYRTSSNVYTWTDPSGVAMCNTHLVINEPSSTYHPGLAIGPYTAQQGTWTIAGTSVPYMIAAQGSMPKAFVTDNPQSLNYFAGLYGAYPYSVAGSVAVNTFPLGAQENLGCCSYRASLVADGCASASSFVAHENAHMWFGNSVTATNWNDVLLIHEGLAVLLENDYVQKFGGKSTYSPVLANNANYGPAALAQQAPYNSAYYVQRELRHTMDGSYLQANAPRHTAFLADLASTYRHSFVTRDQFKATAQKHAASSLSAFWSKYAI